MKTYSINNIKLLKPASRLIIVFVLTMIISGGILTYLSINSISNFRELTEKKITEEQVSIAAALSENFRQVLQKAAENFTDAAIHNPDTTTVIQYPFIISRTNGFIRPWFVESRNPGSERISSEAYSQSIRRAEMKEFRNRDYQAAAYHYQSSHAYARTREDSARSINGLARIYSKMGDDARTVSYYSVITSEFYSVLDNNGFPYVYYAILNILGQRDPALTDMVLPEIEAFLSRSVKGSIPLNNSTAEILDSIRSRLDTYPDLSVHRFTVLNNQIRIISNRLRFLDEFGQVIKVTLREGPGTESSSKLGDYLALDGLSDDSDKLLLMNPDLEPVTGFCIDPDSVWSLIMGIDYCENTEFEYQIKQVDKLAGEYANGQLTLMAGLSSFFPSHTIMISLKDEDLVDIYVKRRSWAYGIALLLLLGAMLLGVLLILRDILREKRLSILRSEFVSNVTHDLKTPLTSIHLYTESILLDRVSKSKDKKEYLQIILVETERLRRIINNILDFSKQEQGKVEYKSEKVNVSELIRSALKDLNYWLEEKSFSVRTELGEDVHIKADYDALKQVVINLLDNAIKYSGENREIIVRLKSDTNFIKIEFEDKGIGIPSDQLEAIFEKFYRVNHAVLKGVGGTGVGLTVVKAIVEGHQGEILVESIPDEGSKFTVLLKTS